MNTEFITKHSTKVRDYVLDWRNWLRGLFGAIVGGVASSITVIIVAPDTFNFDDGFGKLCKVALISAIYNAALFLKSKPLPDEKDTDSDSGTPDVM